MSKLEVDAIEPQSGTTLTLGASGDSVGIGTSSPSRKLDVEGTGIIVEFKSTNNNNVLRIKGNNATNGVAIGSTSSDDFVFTTNATERMRIEDSSGDLQFNSGYGSVATAYGCRAWLSFNGTGTVAINDSGNVTSITDGGAGIYTVNFTTNMPDANYSCMATPGWETSTAVNFNASVHAPAVGSYIIRTRNVNTGNQDDLSLITSAVFR